MGRPGLPLHALVAAALALVAADDCPTTCFDDTCDAWIGKGTTCTDLEQDWGCTCTGCDCDGSGGTEEVEALQAQGRQQGQSEG